MNYGMAFKTKSQINNYFNKHKYKQKNYHNSTTNNTIISEKETSPIVVDTFRKGTLKDNGVGVAKYKTSKNSPEHYSNKLENSKEIRSLSGKHNDNKCNKTPQMKSILSTTKINKMFKETSGFDSMFKRKIQMIHNKHFKGNNSQLTYSNIYNNNSAKIKLENSLYQKGAKNESFAGKKGPNILDDDALTQNYPQKMCNPKMDQKMIDQDTSNEDNKFNLKMPLENKNKNNNINAKETKNSGQLNNNIISSSGYHNNMSSNIKMNHNHSNKNMNNNQSKLKNTRPVSSASSNNYNNHGNILNGKALNIMKQLDKIHSISNPNIISEYKKMSKTAYPSKNNSRKNSIEKLKDAFSNRGYPVSSALKINKYNDVFKNKMFYSKRSISTTKAKTPLANSKGKYKPIVLESNAIGIEEIVTSQNNENTDGINITPMTPDSGAFLSKKILVNNGIKENESDIVLLNNQPKPCITPSNLSNMSNIKFIEYVASNIKGSLSGKNSSLSDKSIKKKDESEKDFILNKLKAITKQNKSLATVQSKQNSKSNSRVEDLLNIPSSNKINEEALFNIDQKGEKAIHMYSLLAGKKSVPIGLCQSPLVKSAQEILKKISLNKSPDHFHEKKSIKPTFKLIADCFKKTPESIEISSSMAKFEEIKINEIDINAIEQRLNETNGSIQSTYRESCFYRREMEKIATYIKKYYLINKTYPQSRLQFYKFGRSIGRGAFGKVNLALHTCSGRLVAIKSFNKSKQTTVYSKNKIKNEIEVLKQLQHPFISQYLYFLYYLTLEYSIHSKQKNIL